MCDFISWMYKDGKNYWVNDSQLDPRISIWDQFGHSTIRCKHFDSLNGSEREYNRNVIPKEILKELSEGKMDLMRKEAEKVNRIKYRITETGCKVFDYTGNNIYIHETTKNGPRLVSINLSASGTVLYIDEKYFDSEGRCHRSNGPSERMIRRRGFVTSYYEAHGKFIKEVVYQRRTLYDKLCDRYKYEIEELKCGL